MDKTFVPIRTDVVLQNETAQLYRSYQDFLQFEHLYSSAVREIQTRLEVLNEEFSVRYDHNPIHHVESRLKSTGSIIEKLRRKGLEISMESAKKNINDIAGIRVVCCYIDDVYRVEEMVRPKIGRSVSMAALAHARNVLRLIGVKPKRSVAHLIAPQRICVPCVPS